MKGVSKVAKFHYKGYGRNESFCDIQVAGNLVIATELPDNPGTSITNAAEDVATAVCLRYQIPMKDLVWIERYHHSPDEYDRVFFDYFENTLRNPLWKRLKGEELRYVMKDFMLWEGGEAHGEGS